MYAFFCTMLFGVDNNVVSPRQANFEQRTAASAQKTIKLCGTRAIRYWFNNPRSSRAPQGYVGMAG